MKRKRTIGSLGRRIIFLVVALFVLVATLLGAISSYAMKEENLRLTEYYIDQLLDQVIHNISYYTGYMEDITALTDKNSITLSLLLLSQRTPPDYSTIYQRSVSVRNFLRQVSIIHNEILDIMIVGENDTISKAHGILNVLEPLSQEQRTQEWYQNAMAAKGKPIFFTAEHAEEREDRTTAVVAIAKSVNLYPGGEALGAIKVELDMRVLTEICSNVTLHESGYVFLVDSENNYLYHPNQGDSTALFSNENKLILAQALESKSNFIFKEGSEELYVLTRPIENTNWALVGVVPYAELVAAANQSNRNNIFISMAAALLIAVLFAIILSKAVFAPLGRLQGAMEQVEEGDFEVAAKVESSNEIGQLTAGFNKMTSRIKDLMNHAVAAEKDKRQAELNVLHAQINPHFLYNTLDSIVWMSEFHPHEAAVLTEKLSKLFRLVLKQGSDIITLKREIEYIDIYLSIQKSRYEEKFDYTINLDESVENEKVPKLIIQVLVENAIYHGIKPKRQKCLLEIDVFSEDDKVVIQVQDDGIGISEQRIAEVLAPDYTADSATGGVGVRNVVERLALYFGNEATLTYDSILGEYTTARLCFPKEAKPEAPTQRTS